MLYKYFEQMISAAEKIAGIKDGDSLGMTGSIDGLDMGEWIPGKTEFKSTARLKMAKPSNSLWRYPNVRCWSKSGF